MMPRPLTTEADGTISVQRGENASFIHKPPRGWLHPDDLIMGTGMVYGVRYIGCLEVNTSMKSLDFETRSMIAKESINRVCEMAGLKTADKRRKVDKRILRMLASSPCMDNAGSNITLTITSAFLNLSVLESGTSIAKHDMPNISFASGGDADTLDFVAYVAKDRHYGRACFVLECGGGLAQDVITTIGQAFELRFKEFLQTSPTATTMETTKPPKRPDPEYYNDLPGKAAPDMPPPVPPLPAGFAGKIKEDSVENLIDLTSDLEHNYVNDAFVNGQFKDPFDMQPFTQALQAPPISTSANGAIKKCHLGATGSIKTPLQTELWFHGTISRKDSEALVKADGDFLVRESLGSPGQYVLTGMQAGTRKHLLLVDPEGVVRTKDRTFESVSHLIHYHSDNGLPIISAESTLVLRAPVLRSDH